MNPFRNPSLARSSKGLVLALGLCVGFTACSPKQDPLDPDQCPDVNYNLTVIKDAQYVASSAAVDAEVTSRMPGKFPGVAVAVVKNGAIVYLKGYGVADENSPLTTLDDTPVTRTTVFGIGSISKVLTATAVMKLAEMGLVDLDTPISNYFPHATPVGWPLVTVRNLLSHRGGFARDPDFNQLGTLTPAQIDAAFGLHASQHPRYAIWEFLGTANARPVVADIGQFAYSNVGYTILGAIVDLITSDAAFPGGPKGYERFVWSLVAGSNDGAITAALDHPWRHDDIVARAESYSAGGAEFATDWSGWQSSSGGWSMTVGDLARVMLALNSEQILGHASSVAMRTNPGPGVGSMDYGLGLVLDPKDGKAAWSHSGRIDGFRSEMIFWPSQNVGVAVLVNGDVSGIDGIAIGVAKHWFSGGGLGGGIGGTGSPQMDPIDRETRALMNTATYQLSKNDYKLLDALIRPTIVRSGDARTVESLLGSVSSQSRSGSAFVDGIRRAPNDIEGACAGFLALLGLDGHVGKYVRR
ncbi:MAG: serine hydrolase domain-containing protein [Planctomycetota bacterium]